MIWSKVCLESITYVLPGEEVSSPTLEARLWPLAAALHLAPGWLTQLTGIEVRRFWAPGTLMSEVAVRAGAEALARAGVAAEDVGALVYAGVCRDNLEPATACAVADGLGIGGEAEIFDLSNACLGALSGLVDIANRIELGQIRAGLVVCAESAREIVDATIHRMNEEPTLERFRLGLATLTGGSGAAALVLTHKDFSWTRHRLAGASVLSAPSHHRICRWGPARGLLGETLNVMETEASSVLSAGIELGRRTWRRFLSTVGWRVDQIDRVIGHQVGAAHRRQILAALELGEDRDFNTFESLGNIGTVSVPMTAAMAEEAGHIREGDRVALLGIGSGLNCMMVGVEW